MQNPVFLIDGSSYIFRAFYAVAPLTTKEGFPTNALYGYSRMLLKFLTEANPEHCAVIFDAGKETFRNKLFTEYKANRKDCPPELLEQMPYFRSIAAALGMPIFEAPGYEADDIIGILTYRLAKEGYHVVVITPDKDLMQLVGDNVSLWDTMRDKKVTRAEVFEKLGVYPESVIDLLALMGDSSDNIPGVQGVGPKTAAQLLANYGSLDRIINSVEEIRLDKTIRGREKIAEGIITAKEQLLLNKKLTAVLLEPDEAFKIFTAQEKQLNIKEINILDALNFQDIQVEDLAVLVNKFEFSSLFSNLIEKAARKNDNHARRDLYELICEENFDQWLAEFKLQRKIAFDLETTSLDPQQAEIVGASFCWSNQKAYYLPFSHINTDGKKQIGWERFLESCKSVLMDPNVQKVGQNIKFDMLMLLAKGVEMKGLFFDTMLAAYLINADKRAYSLDSLAREYLSIETYKYEEVTAGKKNFAEVSLSEACAYAAEDAHIAWLLYETLEPIIEKNGLKNVFYNIEMPLVSILAQIEQLGILLDLDYLKKLSQEFSDRIKIIETNIYELAGGNFNINSPKQLAELLYDKLAIPTKGLKKTKTGYSTDASVLEKIQHFHPIAQHLLEYRLLQKLNSTFVQALIEQVSPVTGRLHTKLHQTGTATGRLSSSDPNLQNIPIQTKEGKRVRKAFIAPPGSLLISADYSQIELRVLAKMSGDSNLINTFLSGEDIHEKTTREILNKQPHEQVSSDERRIGKTINFGIIYGMSGFRLAGELGISNTQAQDYINSYFNRYPKVKELFHSLEEQAVSRGEVETLFGRKRIISSLDTSERDKGFLSRVAINAPIQGTSADLIKLAMITLNENIRNSSIPLKLILQIHDELLFESPKEDVEHNMMLVKNLMEGVVKWEVPLKVDVIAGDNWQVL